MRTGMPSRPQAWGDHLTDVGTVKLYPLGTIRVGLDGNEYVYVKAGGANLVAGVVCTSINTPSTEDTPDQAQHAGDTRVVLTQASITADLLADGYLYVDDGTAIGECYKIRSNTATGTAGSGNQFYADLYEPLATDWSAAAGATDLTYYQSPFLDIVVQVHTTQLKPVCVTQWALATLLYGWALKRGYGAIMLDIASAAGAEIDEKVICMSAVTTGYGGLITTNTAADMAHIVGYIVQDADLTNAKPSLAFIDL